MFPTVTRSLFTLSPLQRTKGGAWRDIVPPNISGCRGDVAGISRALCLASLVRKLSIFRALTLRCQRAPRMMHDCEAPVEVSHDQGLPPPEPTTTVPGGVSGVAHRPPQSNRAPLRALLIVLECVAVAVPVKAPRLAISNAMLREHRYLLSQPRRAFSGSTA
jgi:hypothetical protein